MDNQIVVFELAGEPYGVKISTVESIIKMQAITQVPHTPAFVRGVTNLRGKILPVIDLRKRFGLPDAVAGRDSRIIVVSLAEQEVGMIVDGVSEVLTVSDQTIEPTPTLATSVDSAFITGIAKIDQRLVILLDLDRVLSKEERGQLGEMPGV